MKIINEEKYPLVFHNKLNDEIHAWKCLSPENRSNWNGSLIRDAFKEAVSPSLEGVGVSRLKLLDSVENYEIEDLKQLLLLLSGYLGYIVPQSHENNLIALIQDEGKNYDSPSARGHKTNASLNFHCDRTDLIMLLYVRSARKGGRVSIVTFEDAFQELKKKESIFLNTLFSDYPFDLREERINDSQRWCIRPILWWSNNKLRGHYIRRFIKESQRHSDCPAISENQISALDEFDSVLDGLRAQNTFEPTVGELLVINNYRALHAREAFSDKLQEGEGRLAIRSWVAPFDSEALPDFMLPISGAVKPGCYRGGVGKGDKYLSMLGKTDIYIGQTLSL